MSIGTSRLLSALSCLLLGGPLSLSHAQVTTAITADTTLGTTVTQTGNVHNIDAGTILGPPDLSDGNLLRLSKFYCCLCDKCHMSSLAIMG